MAVAKRPTKEDIRWMKSTLSILSPDGGVWMTEYATYKRYNNTIFCVSSQESSSIDPINVEINIERDKKVIRIIGMEFKDRRKSKYN